MEGGSISLVCDVLTGNPPPQIEWFANGVLLQENLTGNSLLFLDRGRILYIRSLSAEQRSATYHCEVVVALTGERLRDPNTFTISLELFSANAIREYLFLTSIVRGGAGDVGVPVDFVYSAAARDEAGNRIELELSCPSTPVVDLSVSDQFVVTATLLRTPENGFNEVFMCFVGGFGLDNQQVFGSISLPCEFLLRLSCCNILE